MKILHMGSRGNVEKYSRRLELPEHELIDMAAGLPAAEYLAAAGDAEVIFADPMYPVTGEVIRGMPNLKLIHSEGVGFNFFDLEAATERGVYVCNCKGCNAIAVAEQTILLMLGVLRDVVGGHQAELEARQIQTKVGYMASGSLTELADHQIGLVGFGDIAKEVASILRAFHARVYYTKPNRADPETEAKYGVTYLPLDELLATCSMISFHQPVTPETRNMANDAFFAKMRDGAYFINTSRGELADSAAIVRALESGKLKMAGLDCIAGEPVQPDNLLINQPEEIRKRILFSPHIGGITFSGFCRAYAMIWEATRAVAAGQRPANVVNP